MQPYLLQFQDCLPSNIYVSVSAGDRGIDDEEAAYLADVSQEKKTAEKSRQEEIDAELAAFRECVVPITIA